MDSLVFHVEQSQDHLAGGHWVVGSTTARFDGLSFGDTVTARNWLVLKARR